MVTEEGLQCDIIQVYTEDGYIIDMFRVRQPDLPSSAKPVFIQHGFLSDSTTWVIHKEKSITMVLAKAGYDVFLGNNRGNFYGRKHYKLDPKTDKKQFFDYSFYEIGQYDLHAQLYVANKING